MRLHKYIIKTEKRAGRNVLVVTNENGKYIGELINSKVLGSISFVTSTDTIRGYRSSASKPQVVRMLLNHVDVGHFVHVSDYRSDLELSIGGKSIVISSFSDHMYKTTRVLCNGIDVGLMSKKDSLFKREYGFAVHTDSNELFILVALLLHIDYVSVGLLEEYNISI